MVSYFNFTFSIIKPLYSNYSLQDKKKKRKRKGKSVPKKDTIFIPPFSSLHPSQLPLARRLRVKVSYSPSASPPIRRRLPDTHSQTWYAYVLSPLLSVFVPNSPDLPHA